MTYEEKAIQLLNQMPEPYRTFALKSLKEFSIELTQEPESISDVIVNLKWSGKYETLGRIWAHYAYGSSLPELPLEYRYEQLQKENEELKSKLAEFNEYKVYECTDCKQKNIKKDNGEIMVGMCDNCGHPLWNPE